MTKSIGANPQGLNGKVIVRKKDTNKYLLRDRETGEFAVVNPATGKMEFGGTQTAAERMKLPIAEFFKSKFKTHCCHVVPENWKPAHENPSMFKRLIKKFIRV